MSYKLLVISPRLRRGFTLIELLIFSAIFVIIMVAFITIFIMVTRVGTQQTSAAEVNQQSDFLLRQIQYYIEQSSLVELNQDSATSTLKLRMGASSTDPTRIYLSSSTVYLKQTDAGTAYPLTSNKVNVTALTFIKRSNPPGSDAVSIAFTVTYNTSNIQQAFSRSLTTTIARVSPAAFDANVIPSSTATYKIGASGQVWASVNDIIYFSVSSTGIGISSPGQTLEVNGGVRLNTVTSKPTCASAQRGTFWATQGGGGVAEVANQRATRDWVALTDSTTKAFPNSVTSGDLLIVAGTIWHSPAAPDSVTVTDTLGTSYAVVSGVGTYGEYLAFIAYGIAPSSGANTVTVNPSDAQDNIEFSIDEFSGVDTTTPLDVNGGISTGSSATASDAITTLTANDLLIGVMGHGNDTTTLTPGAGYTQIGEWENNTEEDAHNAEFAVATSTQAYTVKWTLGSSVTWYALTAAFKSVGGGDEDDVQVCAKEASGDTYAWRTIY